MPPHSSARGPRVLPLPRAAAWLSAGLALPAALAQTAEGSPFSIVPTFTAQETLTSNRDLSTSNPQSDAITRISPGVRITSRNGRVQGSLDYSLNALLYARASDRNSVQLQNQNALDSAFSVDARDGRARVDVAANISQQSISAFGTQSTDNTLINSNRTEVYRLSVIPSLRGKLDDWADLTASANWAGSRSSSTPLGDGANYGAQLGASGRLAVVGWGLSATRQISEFRVGRRTISDQVGGSLTYNPRYDLNLTLRTGRARSDVLTAGSQWSQTYGGGATWRPTERTVIDVQGDRSYYGNSHVYSVTHSMARSVWSYSDSTSVSGVPGTQTGVQPLTLYDLLNSICLRGGTPAADCDTNVREALARKGLSTVSPTGGGFLAATQTSQRARTLSVSLSGQRETATLSIFRTSTSQLGQGLQVAGDLSQGVPVRQQGYTLGLSHQLTPTAALTLTATEQKTLDSGAQAGNQQRTVTFGWSFNPTARTNDMLTGRHTQFDSEVNPYRESALIGTLGLRF